MGEAGAIDSSRVHHGTGKRNARCGEHSSGGYRYGGFATHSPFQCRGSYGFGCDGTSSFVFYHCDAYSSESSFQNGIRCRSDSLDYVEPLQLLRVLSSHSRNFTHDLKRYWLNNNDNDSSSSNRRNRALYHDYDYEESCRPFSRPIFTSPTKEIVLPNNIDGSSENIMDVKMTATVNATAEMNMNVEVTTNATVGADGEREHRGVQRWRTRANTATEGIGSYIAVFRSQEYQFYEHLHTL
jgi:hypothetical protein